MGVSMEADFSFLKMVYRTLNDTPKRVKCKHFLRFGHLEPPARHQDLIVRHQGNVLYLVLLDGLEVHHLF